MDEAYVELPDGHLVNLSPRPVRQTSYKAYRVEYKPLKEVSSLPPPRYLQEGIPTGYVVEKGASANISQMSKATKLPVPRSLSESLNDSSSQASSPRISKLTPASHSLGRLAEKGPDPYWRKIRDKLEESPLLPRRARSKESDKTESLRSPISYQHSRLPASTSQNLANSRTINAQSGIPSPSTTRSSPARGSRRNEPTTTSEASQKIWRKQGDQWVNMSVTETTRHKSLNTNATTDSSSQSHPSVSPVSAEDSSITDWEDRFVVNMPTAKDPNPPTMTAQQIAEYQISIERVHRAGGQMADPETLPSRNASPEIKFIPSEQSTQSPRAANTYDGTQDGRKMQCLSRDQRRPSPQPLQTSQLEQPSQPQPQQPQPMTASQRQLAGHYYSPDEIGYNRISTIWEESPGKAKEKRHPPNADGSFLGCREISGEKNPDEILTFASPDDASLHPLPLALVSKNNQQAPKQVRKATDRHATTTVLQEERPEISQNSKPAQCSKQSAMYQDRNPSQNPSPMPRTRSQDSSKENYRPTSNTPERSRSLEENRGDDDVFIITPTTTRTMIPTPDKKASSPKPQGLRRPGGANHTVTAEATQAVRAKAQMISTPSGLRPGRPNLNTRPTERTLTTSQTLPLRNISGRPIDRDDEGLNQDHARAGTPERAQAKPPNSIRGFIRTSELARPPGLARSPTDSIGTILRNRTESLRTRAESLRNDSRSPQPVNQQQSPTQPDFSSKDSFESSRSTRSFQSIKDTPNVPANKPPSPPKKVTIEHKLEENKQPPSRPPTPNKPITKRVTLSETSPSSAKPDKPPIPTKKISALAKPSKLDKLSKIAKPAALEKPSPEAKKPDPPAKKEERAKTLPRLRTSGKVLEIAELDGLQVASPKESLQSSITDVSADLCDMHSPDNADLDSQGPNPLALSLLFNILVVAVTQVNRAFRTGTGSPYVKFMVNNALNMTSHCWRVSKCIYVVVSRYQTTGAWPKARNDQAISRFMVELLQAIVYFLILGFAAILIGRTAGYVVLVTSWILWFVRPFAWAFQCVGRALIM